MPAGTAGEWPSRSPACGLALARPADPGRDHHERERRHLCRRPHRHAVVEHEAQRQVLHPPADDGQRHRRPIDGARINKDRVGASNAFRQRRRQRHRTADGGRCGRILGSGVLRAGWPRPRQPTWCRVARSRWRRLAQRPAPARSLSVTKAVQCPWPAPRWPSNVQLRRRPNPRSCSTSTRPARRHAPTPPLPAILASGRCFVAGLRWACEQPAAHRRLVQAIRPDQAPPGLRSSPHRRSIAPGAPGFRHIARHPRNPWHEAQWSSCSLVRRFWTLAGHSQLHHKACAGAAPWVQAFAQAGSDEPQ